MTDQLPAFIGSRIAELRTARGWSLQQVADLAGCSKGHVWELEQGRSKNPSVTMLSALAQAFGVPLSDLIGTPTDKPRVGAHLAGAIAAVNDIWERAYAAGFAAGVASRSPGGPGVRIRKGE